MNLMDTKKKFTREKTNKKVKFFTLKGEIMTPGLKPLIISFTVSGVLGFLGCLWENYHPVDNVKRLYATCEVHADRDVESVVQEMIRDNESDSDRAEREIRETDQKSEYGRMA